MIFPYAVSPLCSTILDMKGRTCSLIRGALVMVVLVPAMVGVIHPRSVHAAHPPESSATLDGRPIAMDEIPSYHCHDALWPEIMCFMSVAARETDLAERAQDMTLVADPYAIVYVDENYGGGSVTLFNSYPDLGAMGWDNVITSFKSLNGGRPKFWDGLNYTSTGWRWAAGALVPNVGSGANDKFSSVKNVP